MKTVSVLGSTGSVGTQTLGLLAATPQHYAVQALVGGRNAVLLAEQAKSLHARIAVIADATAYPTLRDALAGTGIEAASGAEAVVAAAAEPADWTMAAISGAAGLLATLAAIRRGATVALANKEALVCAGEVMLAAVDRHGTTLLPVDSEHNAIFQALDAANRDAVERITLTASGGPFRTASLEEMARARPEAALRHPIWSMGAKISIDSATLMNKGLELIEAARLFGLAGEAIEILVHPQSVVHGMVHYRDGSVLAELGSPDMRTPIAHALAWPQRIATPAPRLELARLGSLTFEAPDAARFPALRLARAALAAGGGAPCVLNAANEVAVAAFLEGRIGFLDIAATVDHVMQRVGTERPASIEAVLALDARAREAAAQRCAEMTRPTA
jgi:1-deoxy-D-xylulose-5-phosphate reductoisomerase